MRIAANCCFTVGAEPGWGPDVGGDVERRDRLEAEPPARVDDSPAANEIAAELATTPDVEPHLDPPALDRHPPSGRSASFALMVSAGDQARASPLLDAECGPAPVLLELLQELRPEQGPLVADELGPEGLHQRRRPDLRHAEEPFDVAPG